MFPRLRVAALALTAVLAIAGPSAAAQSAPDRPLLPREQVQALVRSALQNPGDSAAWQELETALPAGTGRAEDGAAPAGLRTRLAAAGPVLLGGLRTAAGTTAAAFAALGASTGVLVATLIAAVLLLVLIRRQRPDPADLDPARPLAAARELAQAGAPMERVVRETGVSRDVVEMMIRLRPGTPRPTPRAAGPAAPQDDRPHPPQPSAGPATPGPGAPAASPASASTPPSGSLRHLAGGAAAYGALGTAPAPRHAAHGAPAPRPASPAPDPTPSRREPTTLRFTYADLPDLDEGADPRGGGRIDPSTRLGGMIGDLFAPADPTGRTP